MDTLTALKENGPWIAMGQLVKITGCPAPELREELKALIADNKVQKIGKKRGTRYGLAGLKAPESKDNLDFKAEIRRIMGENPGRISRKFLCDKLETYDAKIRPHLLSMVEEGEVHTNGKAKGQLFWLAQHESEGLVKPEVQVPKVVENNSPEPVAVDAPEIKDIEELVRIGINRLPPGPGNAMMVDELKRHICGAANNSFRQSDVFRTFRKMLKAEKLPRVRYEHRDEGGRRLFFWAESIK